MTLSLEKSGLQSTRKQTWSQWKTAYENSKDLGSCLGLLHCIFEVEYDRDTAPDLQQAERLIALCDAADGYGDLHSDKTKTPEDQIKKKAFEVLAHNFFKKKQDFDPWVRKLRWHTPAVLEKLMWFFRPRDSFRKDEEGRGLHNLSRWLGEKNDAKDIANEFLREFVESVWTEKFFSRAEKHSHEHTANEKTLELAHTLKVPIIEIVHASRRMNLFLLVRMGGDSSPQWGRFDEQCMAKLKELGLTTEWWIDRVHQKVETIDEAVMTGSSAAQLYLICKTAQKEHKRQEQIAQAKREAQDAQRRLEKLGQKS